MRIGLLSPGFISIGKRISPSGLVVVREVGSMFVITSCLIDAVVADYILTLLTDLNSGGGIMPLPFQPLYKIVKKSLKHRIYVKFAIIKVSLLKVDFVRSG